jgi:hypothetical protein
MQLFFFTGYLYIFFKNKASLIQDLWLPLLINMLFENKIIKSIYNTSISSQTIL